MDMTKAKIVAARTLQDAERVLKYHAALTLGSPGDPDIWCLADSDLTPKQLAARAVLRSRADDAVELVRILDGERSTNRRAIERAAKLLAGS